LQQEFAAPDQVIATFCVLKKRDFSSTSLTKGSVGSHLQQSGKTFPCKYRS